MMKKTCWQCESPFTTIETSNASSHALAFSPITPQHSLDSVIQSNTSAGRNFQLTKYWWTQIPSQSFSKWLVACQKQLQVRKVGVQSIFYTYAVRDRVDLSNCISLITDREMSIASLLPTDNDMPLIICRILWSSSRRRWHSNNFLQEVTFPSAFNRFCQSVWRNRWYSDV